MKTKAYYPDIAPPKVSNMVFELIKATCLNVFPALSTLWTKAGTTGLVKIQSKAHSGFQKSGCLFKRLATFFQS